MLYRCFSTAFVLAVFMLAAPMTATAQSSYTGSKEGFIGAPKKSPPPMRDDVSEEEFNKQVDRLPPVFDSVAPPTAVNEDGYAEGVASDDPCAAYLNDFNGYTVCQDRMQKIEKMKAGKERRKADYGTTQPIRPSEQRRIDAEKAAAEKARAEEEAKAKAENGDSETTEEKTEEKTEEPEKEKTRLEKYQDRKDDYIKKKPIGVK